MSDPSRSSQANPSKSPGASSHRHLVLWDGDCAFCSRCVDWARARDHGERFDFARYQSVATPPMTPELEHACAKAVHVLTRDGRTISAGRALLFILEGLGWRRSCRLLARPPLVWCVELGYWLVARNRAFVGRFVLR